MSDVIKPWTLKGIPPEVRNGATMAAKRSSMGIAEWVARAILSQVQADQNASSAVTVAENTSQAVTAATPAQITEVIALAKEFTEVTGKASPEITKALRGLIVGAAMALEHRGPPPER